MTQMQRCSAAGVGLCDRGAGAREPGQPRDRQGQGAGGGHLTWLSVTAGGEVTVVGRWPSPSPVRGDSSPCFLQPEDRPGADRLLQLGMPRAQGPSAQGQGPQLSKGLVPSQPLTHAHLWSRLWS